MASVLARLVSLDEDHFPGWARVRLDLVDGTTVEIEEKQPVIGIDGQLPGELVPLACEVLQTETGRSAAVRLLHGVETTDGRDTLIVRREALRTED